LNAVLEIAGGGHMREVSGGALVDDLALVGRSAVVESWAGFVRDGLGGMGVWWSTMRMMRRWGIRVSDGLRDGAWRRWSRIL
jgi:hypothetical protein